MKENPEVRVYPVFHSPFDPCPPKLYRSYVVPVNQYVVFQPPGLPQFSPAEALRHGTLWPSLYSPYTSRKFKGE
ncbi:spore coat associated protein CotJA [Paenibacillus sp. FSL W7-1279]|uniref:spore coat associated protein CotJA n=1 Tax=Paenibacillus TaxID=44249 RepID=UPI0009433E07|nr:MULTISPECIES: spore coat associated protein CotJA [Paenibacillus]MBU5344809.1 spore coat associated protein CotJA [Paenibacillus lautus]MCT1401703.1 spore coat associated protein CotJA [Paenibacillus sp. p3-SID867]